MTLNTTIWCLYIDCLADKLTEQQTQLAILIYIDLLTIIGKPEPIRVK